MVSMLLGPKLSGDCLFVVWPWAVTDVAAMDLVRETLLPVFGRFFVSRNFSNSGSSWLKKFCASLISLIFGL